MPVEYRNASRAITIRVTEDRDGSIDYVGTGNRGTGYRGYLHYSLSENALVVGTLDAKPEGAGLGSLLLLEAAIIAPRYGKNRVEAISVAATARAFYLKLRFHPSSRESQAINQLNLPPEDFGTRLHLGRTAIGTWEADRNQLQQAAAAQLRASGWSPVNRGVVVV
jgi:hypothetical protein